MVRSDEFSEVIVQRVRTKYHWPALQLNFWLLIMFVAASLVLGVFGRLVYIQGQYDLKVPWYFTYHVTMAVITLLFLLAMLYLISLRRLLPGIVIIAAFILFVLWLTGVITTGIVFFGPVGNIDHLCDIVSHNEVHGVQIGTAAWLEEDSECAAWKAAFSFEIVGVVFLLWVGFMALGVYRSQ